eukprot:COSAG04_NODE_370_length_15729_cov_5.743506_8_plen_318_part_00
MNRVGFHGTHETQPAKMMYLDSHDATQLTEFTSHCTYEFKDAIETSRGEGLLVSLTSASIPYSFYNIRTGINDKLYYERPGILDKHIQLEAGNYTATALSQHIHDKSLNEGGGLSMTVTYNKTTQKFIFKSNLELTFKFLAVDALRDEIGFGGLTEYHLAADTNSTPADYGSADLNGSVHAIYVRTNLATRSVMESHTHGVSDILAKIDINADPGGVVTLDPNQVSHEALIHTAGVTNIEVRITDERNRLLDLNGLHWQLGIRFRFVNIKISEPIATGGDRERLAPQDIQNALDEQKRKKVTLRKKALKKGKAMVKG